MIDLAPDHLEIVLEILSQRVPAREVWIFEVNRILSGVKRDAGFSTFGYIAYNAGFSNKQAVIPFQHIFSAFTVCCNQYCVFPACIEQEDAHVVKVKVFRNRLCDLRLEFARRLY